MVAASRWSDIPQDIFFLILRRLILVDYVRSSAVCSSWHSAARERRYPPAPQPPWLMFAGPEADPSAANFLSLSRDGRHNKVYTLRLPFADLRDRNIVGSSYGWLITVDRRCIASMLNPITGAEITLPPITTFPHMEAILDPSGAVTEFVCSLHGITLSYTPEKMRFFFAKIIVVPGPAGIGAGDYTAVALAQTHRVPAFARGGENKWSSLQSLQSVYLYQHAFDDIIYNNGLFYGVAYPGDLTAFDLSGPVPQVKIVTVTEDFGSHEGHPTVYVVESSGDLLVVLRFTKVLGEGEPQPLCERYEKAKVETYEVLVLMNNHNQWVEVKNLGDQALFLGLSYSISLSVLEFTELKENCIYFTDDNNFYDYAPAKRDVGVYSLESGKMNLELLEPYRYELNWPLPMWMTPYM